MFRKRTIETTQKAYKFRAYPSHTVKSAIEKNLEACRFVYNFSLEEMNKQEKKDAIEIQNKLPKLREEKPFLKETYSKCLQAEVHKVFSNLRVLSRLRKKGKRGGKLRFKGKGFFKTITFNQSGFKIEGNKIIFSGIGAISIKLHRKIEGVVKQVSIKKEQSGKYFVIVMVDQFKTSEKKQIKKCIGVDLGSINLTHDSNNKFIKSPKHLEKSLKKLMTAQRLLSRKQRGSNNRNKARINLARVYEKVRNQRLDFLHKLSHFYVSNYDLIAIEDMQIQEMAIKTYNARHLLQNGWNILANQLSYKAESAGKILVKVEASGTTTDCSRCGFAVKKQLSDRTHVCPRCGLKIDRDYNASINILKRGVEKVRQELPTALVEMEPLPDKNFGQVLSVKQEASALIAR
ncbi:MAG: transposase [Candidatus Micrarchaeota archaeon]